MNKQNYIKIKGNVENRLKEIRKFSLKKECMVLSKINDQNKSEQSRNLFPMYQQLIKDYKELSSKSSSGLEDISHIIILSSACEGLIKIVLLTDDPYDYLDAEQRDRTLGKLKKKLINKLREKDKNNDNILVVEKVLDLIIDLRNKFVHFPIYYEYDYRFERLYFNLMAYIIEAFGYWNEIDEEVARYIKEKAKQKVNGIDLLDGVVLYEQIKK
jgi:hypothetical protein